MPLHVYYIYYIYRQQWFKYYNNYSKKISLRNHHFVLEEKKFQKWLEYKIWNYIISC